MYGVLIYSHQKKNYPGTIQTYCGKTAAFFSAVEHKRDASLITPNVECS